MTKLIHLSGSDHITSELFTAGPDTFTIAGVVETTLEGDKQRHAVQLKELNGKTWVPALTVLKALASIWGMETSNWVGQRLTLYRDPKVKIGKEVVGGIRVSHVTGITEPKTVKVKGAMNRPVSYTFQPLPDAASAPTQDTISQQAWQEISSLAAEKGIDQPGPWAAEQLGRKLNGPQDITTTEGDRLLGLLTTGEVTEDA